MYITLCGKCLENPKFSKMPIPKLTKFLIGNNFYGKHLQDLPVNKWV